ncbi:hypothetical protein J4438_03960 [Candidatus Woesearchaeota archaeon]|nr:hypothetical protein [Candidatus Woesearchaeota archaeon]
MDTIENILKREFPELKVEIPSIPGTSDIKSDELSKAILYIRENKLVQDSINLLTCLKPMRSSVIYPINFPNQERGLMFRVDWVQESMIYVGYVQSRNFQDNRIQARFYSMTLKQS